jgi:RHS repeat-associated protein
VRLARVVHGDSTEVYLELGDHLGSTSVVLDHATGELVQRDSAYAYGAAESSYRPEKFEEFREDYRFTGKEDDVEVGLIYFGKRYYAPLLQRWISADPLAVHAPGEADLNLYAYVHGRVLVAVDPVGLQEEPNASNAGCQGAGGSSASAAEPKVEVTLDFFPKASPSSGSGGARPAPSGAHATPHETGALTQQGISQGGGTEAYEAWAAGLYGAAWTAARIEQARNAPPIQLGVGDRTGPLMIDVMGAAAGLGVQRYLARMAGASASLEPGLVRAIDDAVDVDVVPGPGASIRERVEQFLPKAVERQEAVKSRFGYSDAVGMARKPDIKQVDRIVRDLGLNKDQRRILHDDITGQELSIDEIREIAQEIAKQMPKGGKN